MRCPGRSGSSFLLPLILPLDIYGRLPSRAAAAINEANGSFAHHPIGLGVKTEASDPATLGPHANALGLSWRTEQLMQCLGLALRTKAAAPSVCRLRAECYYGCGTWLERRASKLDVKVSNACQSKIW